MFIKSVDLTDHMAEGGRKNATCLAEQISSGIRGVSAENIVQVVMDRANKACWPIINTTTECLLQPGGTQQEATLSGRSSESQFPNQVVTVAVCTSISVVVNKQGRESRGSWF